MSDQTDIVTILRATGGLDAALMERAAREIERLRLDKAAADRFLRGDETLVIDEQDAANLFRLSRDVYNRTYTVKLADLFRLAADHRGRNEPDEEIEDE